MHEFSVAAMGGTFDIIHGGHLALLSRAFAVSDHVIIGLASDGLVRKKAKDTVNGYPRRLEALTRTISDKFPRSSYRISMLDDDFGPAILEGGVEALIVSDETSGQGAVLNRLRAARNLPPVRVITVPMLLAEDGARISSTRIRNSEIDAEGKLLIN